MAVGFSPSTRVVRLLGGRKDASKLNPSARTTEAAGLYGDDSGALGGTGLGAELQEAERVVKMQVGPLGGGRGHVSKGK